MPADTIEYTTISLYANDISGIDSAVVKVGLSEGIVRYKDNVSIRNVDLEYTPDSITGLIEIVVPDTDNMSGDQAYIFDFGNGIKYKSKVPRVDSIVFWDLDLEKSTTKDFPTFRGI